MTIKLYLFYLLREEKQYITVPRNIEGAQNLGRVLSKYKDMYYFQVLAGYFTAYILYPSFVILYVIFALSLARQVSITQMFLIR